MEFLAAISSRAWDVAVINNENVLQYHEACTLKDAFTFTRTMK